MGILNIDLNNNNLDNTIYEKDDADTIISYQTFGLTY